MYCVVRRRNKYVFTFDYERALQIGFSQYGALVFDSLDELDLEVDH